MDVAENVAYGLKQRKVPKSEIASRVAEALDMVKMGHLAARKPKQLSGADSVAAEKAVNFAERLSAKFDIEISMVDERLSTVSASRQLRDAGVDAKNAKALIDSAAAVAILEQGLALDKR
jgi:putative Holliday junction resolvase